MSEERIEMLKEMIEQSVNPVGWLGYQEGHLVSFLQTQEQLDSFLKNTEPTGKVIPVYTHPIRKLTDEEISQVYKEVSEPFGKKRLYEIHDFARAILKKASEK